MSQPVSTIRIARRSYAQAAAAAAHQKVKSGIKYVDLLVYVHIYSMNIITACYGGNINIYITLDLFKGTRNF